MKEKVKEYAELVEKIKKIDDEIKEKKDALKREISVLTVQEDYEVLNDQLATIQEEIQEKVLANFKETGEKNTPYGIKVQETNEFSYDEKKAFQWAKDHGLFLTLDKKAFDKYAKGTDEIDFVKKSKGTRVAWPKKIILED